MLYKKDDLIMLLEDKQILDGIYLKTGTLVYINEIDNNMINVSEINSDYDFWITSHDTKLVRENLKRKY